MLLQTICEYNISRVRKGRRFPAIEDVFQTIEEYKRSSQRFMAEAREKQAERLREQLGQQFSKEYNIKQHYAQQQVGATTAVAGRPRPPFPFFYP